MSTEIDQLLEAFEGSLDEMTIEEMVRFKDNLTELEARSDKVVAPQTDDELWDFLNDEMGLRMPRVAVIEGHTAPFQILADLFFRRTTSAIIIGNRGGGKTFLMALLHYLNGRFRRNVEALTAGATLEQGLRCYQAFKQMVVKYGGDLDGEPIQKITKWKSGCELRVVAGTPKAMNGPHPAVVHRDEVDQFHPEAFEEGNNMAQSKMNDDGTVIPAQDIKTSTRKSKTGRMQQMVDEREEEVRLGQRPRNDLYIFGIFEVAQKREDCCRSNPMLEPGISGCDCHTVVSGKWGDDRERAPRTLADVCDGKFAKSEGHIFHDDIRRMFIENSQKMWEAQIECLRPTTEGMILESFERETHCIRNWSPRAEFGRIYCGIDFGWVNPNAVIYFQVLSKSVEVDGYEFDPLATDKMRYKRVVLPEGSVIAFDEIYRSEIDATELASRMKAKEDGYRKRLSDFRVYKRYADPANPTNRAELRRNGLACTWEPGATRDRKEHYSVVNVAVNSMLFYVDATRCSMLLNEIDMWRYPTVKGDLQDTPEVEVDDFNHACAAMRYFFVNHAKTRKKRSTNVASRLPGTSEQTHITSGQLGSDYIKVALPSYSGRQHDTAPSHSGDSSWRDSYGPLEQEF